jgi:Tol biopolymer transport system component
VLIPNHLRRVGALPALALLALALGGGTANGAATACSGAVFGGGCLSVVDSLQNVRPSDDPAGTATASLTAAKNEFESVQLVVRAGPTALTNVSVSLAAGGTIPANAVTIYREAYLDIATRSDLEGATGRYPDALIPTKDTLYNEARNAFPITVPANESRVVWVDVLAKPELAAGGYDGNLHVTADGPVSHDVPLHLNVLPFSMPSTPSLTTVFDIDYRPVKVCAPLGLACGNTAQTDAALALYERLALDNRVSLAKPGYAPLAGADKTAFESITLPFVKGTASTRLAQARNSRLFLYASSCDDVCTQAWKAEAIAQGFEGSMAIYACDEPYQDPAKWTACKTRIDHVRSVWGLRADGKRLPALGTGGIADSVDFGSTTIRDAFDVFVPNVFVMHGKPGDPFHNRDRYLGDHSGDYAAWRSPDRQVWLYQSCESFYCAPGYLAADDNEYFRGWPSFAIDQPAFEQRSLGWLSYRYGAAGQYYFETVNQLSTAWTNQFGEGGNGDGTLFYPGTPGLISGADPIPLESIRLKRIRDGIEDYELLHILDARGGVDRTYAQTRVATLFGADAMWTVPSAAAVATARADLQQRIVSGIPTGGTAAIAFTSTRAGNKDVYAIDPDGTHEVRLTSDPAADSQPAWSPSGTRIAFTSARGGGSHLWAMNADGSGQVQISLGADSKPAWSPDGAKIAFVRRGTTDDLWVMDAGGANAHALVATPADEYDPTWSPDGTTIVFSRAGNLFRVTVPGGVVTQLTTAAGDEDSPAWSHSGARIAYDGVPAAAYQLYEMNGDATGQTNHSSSAVTSDYQPAWSPDDAKLVFARASGLWTATPAGTGVAQLTSTAGDSDADWRPASTPPGRSTAGALTCGSSPRLSTGAPTLFGRSATPQWILWRTTFWQYTGGAWSAVGTGPWMLTSATTTRAGQTWWRWNGTSYVSAGTSATVSETNAGTGTGYFKGTESFYWYEGGNLVQSATKTVATAGGPNAVAHQPFCLY